MSLPDRTSAPTPGFNPRAVHAGQEFEPRTGAVDERTLTAKLFRGEAKLSDKISEHMEARLPVIGSLESITTARELLSDADTLMVTFVGAPVGILTRHDLLAYLSN